MRKEIIADFDDVQKHLKDGWTVEIGGDPVRLGPDRDPPSLNFRGRDVYKVLSWELIADRTAVCTKADEPVIGDAYYCGGVYTGKERVTVYVPKGQGEQFRDKTVELRVVEP